MNMNSIRKRALCAVSALAALASPVMQAQQWGLYVTGGEGQLPWPPESTTPMTRIDGSFHVHLTDIYDGFKFQFADFNDGTPERFAPAGDKHLPHYRNSVYEMTEDGGMVTGYVPREVSWSDNISTADVDLWTDRARYNPGEDVWIQCSKFAEYPEARVRYRRGADVLAEHPLVQEWWKWNPPVTDFQGYLVDVYRLDADGREEILASIGVDVSSDWKRFPRYGYTAWYEPGKEQYIGGDVAFLNRRHINAVQFQDWHWKHHYPYCPDETYTDIANREISANVIREFISSQHGYNMLSIFYNLAFGALDRDGAEADGVRPEWYVYKNSWHGDKDYHTLPSEWKSDISIVDPGNTDWQNYMAARNQEVYEHFNFDGYQVDQLGNRGTLYDYWGNRIDLAERYAPFLKAMKNRHPAKRLVMNSVSKYGSNQIAASGVVDVCYNEMWASESDLMDLYWVIFDNNRASGNTLRTVFAAYMNYDYGKDNGGKTFHTPGILLTDACIFALGGAHLELGTGGNMLCNEYFPNTNLKLDAALTDAITRYYDFATAYENILYDTSRELSPTITSLSGHKLSVWNYQKGPQPRRIVVHGKETNRGQMVYHLLNFTNTNSLSWRDVNADRNEPDFQGDITLLIDSDRMVSRAWVASPDSNACVPLMLPFTQEGRSVKVTVPSLKYWTMLVLE